MITSFVCLQILSLSYFQTYVQTTYVRLNATHALLTPYDKHGIRHCPWLADVLENSPTSIFDWRLFYYYPRNRWNFNFSTLRSHTKQRFLKQILCRGNALLSEVFGSNSCNKTLAETNTTDYIKLRLPNLIITAIALTNYCSQPASKLT